MPRHKEATRDAIIDTALRLFSERGYDAVRIEDVARAAGVSRATFYNHFAERDAILAALIERLLADDGAGDDEAGDPGEDRPPLERLRELALNAAQHMLANDALARFVYTIPVRHESLLKPEEPTTPRLFLAIHHLVEQGVRRGDVRDDVDVDVLCGHVHGALETAMRAWAEGRIDDPVKRLDTLIELAFHGIVTGPARSARRPPRGATPETKGRARPRP